MVETKESKEIESELACQGAALFRIDLVHPGSHHPGRCTHLKIVAPAPVLSSPFLPFSPALDVAGG